MSAKISPFRKNLAFVQMGIFHLTFYLVVTVHPFCLSKAESFDYPTANLSTSWKNSQFLPRSVEFRDNSTVRPILLRGSFGPKFACGFFCNGTCDSYLFAIFIVETNSSLITSTGFSSPQVVWSANRNNPLKINSTLELKSNGDLVLEDFDGTVVWSAGTAGKSVAGLNLTELGNLVLFDRNNSVVWQSFDHPTDVLVPGQKLIAGKKLIPSFSPTNWTQFNLFSLSVTDEGMYASVESNPGQVFAEMSVYGKKSNKEPTYVMLQNGSFGLFLNSSDPNYPDMSNTFPASSSAQYVKLWADGHLRVHQLGENGWQVVDDLLKSPGDECFYPTVCGNYGICSNGQCSCPAETGGNGKAFFNQIDGRQPNLGCSETTPLSCQSLQNHSFIQLTDATYASFSEQEFKWSTNKRSMEHRVTHTLFDV